MPGLFQPAVEIANVGVGPSRGRSVLQRVTAVTVAREVDLADVRDERMERAFNTMAIASR